MLLQFARRSFSLLVVCSVSATWCGAQTFLVPADDSRVAVAACSGTIMDPGGAGNYTSGQLGELTVYPDRPGVLIELEVESWDVAVGDDLTVSGGARRGDTLVTTILSPIQVGDRFVASSWLTSSLHLDFLAGSGQSRAGFELRVRCVPDGPLRSGDDRLHVLRGKVFTDSGGLDEDYGNQEMATTRLRSLGHVEASFSTVDLEPCCDELVLRSSSGAELANVTAPGPVFAFREIDAEFTSDGSVTGSGWRASLREFFELVNLPPGSFSVVQQGKVLVHPGGPAQPYGDLVSRSAGFVASAEDRDLGLFLEPSLGLGDEIRVYGGVDTTAPLLTTAQVGSGAQWLSVPGNRHMVVEFTSDAADGGAFLGTWQEIVSMHQSRSVSACEVDIFDSGGLVGEYGPNEDVVLVVRPDNPAAWVEISFLEFFTESGIDVLRAYDGDSVAAPELGSWSGSTLPPVLAPSGRVPGQALTLRFTTDASVESLGFHARMACRLSLFEDDFESGDASRWSSFLP